MAVQIDSSFVGLRIFLVRRLTRLATCTAITNYSDPTHDSTRDHLLLPPTLLRRLDDGGRSCARASRGPRTSLPISCRGCAAACGRAVEHSAQRRWSLLHCSYSTSPARAGARAFCSMGLVLSCKTLHMQLSAACPVACVRCMPLRCAQRLEKLWPRRRTSIMDQAGSPSP